MGSYPLSSQAPTHVEVELGCDNSPEQKAYGSQKKIRRLSYKFSQLLCTSKTNGMSCAVGENLELMKPVLRYLLVCVRLLELEILRIQMSVVVLILRWLSVTVRMLTD